MKTGLLLAIGAVLLSMPASAQYRWQGESGWREAPGDRRGPWRTRRAPLPREDLQIFRTHATWNVHLFRKVTPIGDMSATFEITRPSHVTIVGHVNLKHRNIGTSGVVGWALRLGYRGPYASREDLEAEKLDVGLNAPPWIKGGKAAGNIRDVTDHYAEAQINGYQVLDEPGWYRIEIWGVSHSSLAPNTDGLVEVNAEGGKDDPYNALIIRVEDY